MKSIISITESELHSIVKETVKRFIKKKASINESASALLYHFIMPRYLLSLLKRNSFRTSEPEIFLNYDTQEPEYINGKNQRFISLTRNKNHKEGYPVIMLGGMDSNYIDTIICRITIDGNALNTYNNFKSSQGKQHNIKVKPLDWAYYDNNKGDIEQFLDNHGVEAQNGKEWMLKSKDSTYTNTHDGGSSIDNRKEGQMSDLYSHPFSQAEDRLTTDVKYIPNANKYIKCIDIYVREHEGDYYDENDMISDEEFNYLTTIYKYCKKLNIPIYFYNDEKQFTKQNINKSISFNNILETHWNYKDVLFGI